MAKTSVSIPLVGPTYTNRSLPVNSQVTQNFYLELNQEGGEPASLQPFPGLKPFANTTDGGPDRGFGAHLGVFYKITGTSLYSITSGGVTSNKGTIPGSGRCKLESDGINLVITNDENKPLTWSGTVLTQGLDIDLPNAATVAYINRRVVYDAAGASIAFADLDNAISVSSNNVTTVDTTPSNILAVTAKDQQIFAFSSDAVTPFYNSGVGNPPYDIIQNGVSDIGLKAIHSIGKNKDFIYFLGSDLVPYRIGGLQAQPIGNPAIGQEIASYTNPEDAIGFCFTLDNQNFYYLSFPNNRSWLYNENLGWTNLAFGGDKAPHLMNSYINIYDRHLVADRRDGNVYELDFDTFDDNGSTIIHQRDTVQVDGKTFGKPGARVFMSKLKLKVEMGTSLITGQGSDAEVIMSYSDDFGNTFSSERRAKIGKQGEYKNIVEWFLLGEFYSRIFRFTMSDPVRWSLVALYGDVELDNG
ncbi:MAG: hypothetical protein V3R25_09195 [Nitrosomonadaceae bacterium]